MKFFSKKIIELNKADIHLHYANNKGRGSDNVTVTIVKKGTIRPATTSRYDDNDVITQYRCSGWSGVVNINNETIDRYN